MASDDDNFRYLLQSFREERITYAHDAIRAVAGGATSNIVVFDTTLSTGERIKRKDAEGKDRQVQALYLGLGHAYYADQGGSFAGVGVPGEADWTWEEKPELGSTIRKVIDIYENEEKAEFIPVPVSIK